MSKALTTKQKILDLLEKTPEMTPGQLIIQLKLSPTIIYANLKLLLHQQKITKYGTTPNVIYALVAPEDQNSTVIDPAQEAIISPAEKEYLNQNYMYIAENGVEIKGYPAFIYWASSKNKNKDLKTLVREWITVRKETAKYINNDGYLDMTDTTNRQFNHDGLLYKVFVSDFYTLPNGMGKTLLGTQVYYAKMSEVLRLTMQIANQVKPTMEKIIALHKVTVVGYIPHSKKRKIQFIPKFKEFIDLSFRKEIVLTKTYPTEIRVEQKTLRSTKERENNARQTISLTKIPALANNDVVLLIDDLVGSGATVHEMAKKIKRINPQVVVIAYGIVGNADGRIEVERAI